VIAKAPAGSGDQQSGTVGQALAAPLVVLVTRDGQPVAGEVVAWTTGAGTVSPVSGVTDGAGLAATTWTLNTTAGTKVATATLAGASGSPVSFSATALAGPPASLLKLSGDLQANDVGLPLAQPLVVRVVDQFNNGLAGATVTWQVTQGTALLSAASTPTVNGNAQVGVTLGGTAGAVTIEASASAPSGSPQSFTATSRPLPTDIVIRVINSRFDPQVDTVAVGGTVTWDFPVGSAQHNVISTGSPAFTSLPSTYPADSALFDGPLTYGPLTFNGGGTYRFYCTDHGTPNTGMRGSVVVR
jgi:plastocyanin